MKLCIDCKHFVPSANGNEFSKCALSLEKEINPIDGKERTSNKKDLSYCDAIRGLDWPAALLYGYCGKSGRYWEP